MINPSRQFPHMSALADYIEVEATGIRERASRASIEATFAIADQAIARGDADPVFIAAQREFTEARVQCALACARADNAGHPHEAVLAAAGSSLGQMIGSLLMGLSDEEQAFTMEWIEEAMNGVLTGQPSRDGTPVARVTSQTIVGGNA